MKTINILGIRIAIFIIMSMVFLLGGPAGSSADSSAVSASCSASASSVGINQSVTFSATASGGTGSYTYSWSGACSGSDTSCSNSFTNPGTQTAAITVTSNSQNQSSSASASCSVSVVGQIICSTNSQCGTNGVVGSPFCQSGNVYQNYITYTCNNPGTASSSCTNATAPQLQNTCTANQTCANGSCVNQTIACSTNSQCGTNGVVGSPFCQSGNVYQNYITYTCNNPGTASSSCTNATTPQLQNTCTANQVCASGSCVNQTIACSTNSQCGTNGVVGSPFCQSNNVYQNYTTHTCNNPGTATSYCSDSTTAQLQNTCTGSQICTNGSCNNNNTCTSNYQQRCSGSNLYWYDSCGNQQNLIQYCPNGCSGNSCTINNSYSTVQTNSATNVNGSQATLNGYLYVGNNNYNYNYNCSNYVWFQYGINTYYGIETLHQSQNYSGVFGQVISSLNSSNIYHFRAVDQDCSGNISYGQDMIIYSSGVGGTLTVSKTVKDLTSNSGFSTSTYANPSDVLMFMITLQATGNQDVQNVFVKDILPLNLIYNNQLVVACTTSNGNNSNCNNNNYNYSGNITSGINLSTIYAGQTVTITYQVQVAGVTNFSYGSTTLNNSVSVTSSQSGYVPTSSASVIVTRSTVLGASTVSTGLTNNFWVDSFFLPLLITLILIWMWRFGMFFRIEKWLDSKKKIRRGYKAGKELSSRIESIQKTEKA